MVGRGPLPERRGAAAPGLGRVLLWLLCAAVLGAYVLEASALFQGRILHQIRETGHAFVLSDLYPRWYGAKALLAGVNPYGGAFTEELQRQYYGLALPEEVERSVFGTTVGFFYPPYVVLPLLPFLWLPFEVVRWMAVLGLAAALVASVWLWSDLLGYAQSAVGRIATAAASVLFFPSLDLLWLQQLTGLVLLYLVGGYAAAARRRYWLAGGLLALAMIKPQTAALPAAGLLFWSVWRRERWPVVWGFGAAMLVQYVLSQELLRGWLGQFLEASRRYQELNEIGYWLPLMVTLRQMPLAVGFAAALLAMLGWLWWRHRAEDVTSPGVLRVAAMGFAVGVVVMPDISFYNKSLLLVPLLTLAAAGVGRGVLRRASARVAWLTVLAPAAALAALGPFALAGGGDALQAGVMGAGYVYIALPVLLLPALLTLCFSTPAGEG
jgi:hypothetical protein